jgi:hypothetical protein
LRKVDLAPPRPHAPTLVSAPPRHPTPEEGEGGRHTPSYPNRRAPPPADGLDDKGVATSNTVKEDHLRDGSFGLPRAPVWISSTSRVASAALQPPRPPPASLPLRPSLPTPPQGAVADQGIGVGGSRRPPPHAVLSTTCANGLAQRRVKSSVRQGDDAR